MNDDATNLDRMHDIVVPDPIPWWPPAAGWYVVLTVVLCVTVYLAWRVRRRWRANAYRREALRELEHVSSVPAVSELLRRTALAVAPRSVVAAQVGTAWPAWLQDQSPAVMPERVRKQLALGPYAPAETAVDVSDLKQYAAEWIRKHQFLTPSETPSSTHSQ